MIQQSPSERASLAARLTDAREVFDSLSIYVSEGSLAALEIEQSQASIDAALSYLASQAAQPAEADGVEWLRALSERATPGPWAWEQCGEKEDAPVVGIIFPSDDHDCERPYAGRVQGDDDAYRTTIARDWQSCDGHSASANADFTVAAVNYVRALLAATPKAPATDAGSTGANSAQVAGDDARSAFYAESIAAVELMPGTQVVAIDSFMRAVSRLATPPAPNDDLRAALEALLAAHDIKNVGEGLRSKVIARATEHARAALKENRRG